MSASLKPVNQIRPRGILVVAILMILFGLAEVGTGFKHSFFGIITTQDIISTYLGVALGAFYFMGGLLVMTSRKWAGTLATVLLCADVVGRIAMVLTGLYPINSFLQTFSMVIGTSIAVFFAIYLGLNLKFFR